MTSVTSEWSCWFRIVMDPELRRGPSIPFILGACRDPLSADPAPQLSKDDLYDLLTDMRDDTPEPYCIEILRCSDIRAYVASARTTAPEGRICIESPSNPARALYSCDSIHDHAVDDLETL